jgi:hypothetical protein
MKVTVDQLTAEEYSRAISLIDRGLCNLFGESFFGSAIGHIDSIDKVKGKITLTWFYAENELADIYRDIQVNQVFPIVQHGILQGFKTLP